MRLRITRLSDGLPLLKEIPAHGVCRIEGYNGIGKSLSIRVLRLCAGEQPFPGQQALWDGFRSGIGMIRVEADDLAGQRQIRWELNGDDLPASVTTDAAEPHDDWFRVLEVDGAPASLARIGQLLQVRTIAANQGLLDTLASEVSDAANDVRIFERTTVEGPRLDEMQEKAGDIRRLLAQISPSRLRERREAERAADVIAAATRDASNEAEARLATIRDLQELQGRLAELTTTRPQIETELESLQTTIADVRDKRDALVNQVTALEQQSAASEEAKRELRRYETTRKREGTRLENATRALAEALEAAGLTNTSARDSELNQTLNQLAELQRRRTEIDASPVLLGLIQTLTPPLDRADAAGAGEQVVAEISSRDVSVRSLRTALGERRLQLEQEVQSAATERIDRQIAILERRRLVLQSIPELMRSRSDAHRRRDSAEARAQELNELIANDDAAELEMLRKKRRQVDEQLYELSARRAALLARLDALDQAGDLDALRQRFHNQLSSLGLEAAALADEGTRTEQRVAEMRMVARASVEDLRDARAAFARDLDELTQVVEALSEDPETQWLRRSQHLSIPKVDEPLDVQLESLEGLEAAVTSLDRRLDKFRNTVTAARSSLAAVSSELQGAKPVTGGMYDDALAWASKRAQEWFDEPRVRAVLLHEQAAEVKVELSRRVVIWRTNEGQKHTTPLEAFSSGQSVFAYTEAQLMLLDRPPSKEGRNRLIVIDEFGAFVARDRLDDLKATLRSWQHRHPDDQILLILPVSQDYEELANATVNPARKRQLEAIVAALETDGYFTDAFAT